MVKVQAPVTFFFPKRDDRQPSVKRKLDCNLNDQNMSDEDQSSLSDDEIDENDRRISNRKKEQIQFSISNVPRARTEATSLAIDFEATSPISINQKRCSNGVIKIGLFDRADLGLVVNGGNEIGKKIEAEERIRKLSSVRCCKNKINPNEEKRKLEKEKRQRKWREIKNL
ncbi:hypothetical protein L1887_25275 [Cichorium endivia]|nr:hypothetical protein L1887_25275 [Cichorium endivia]